MAKTASENKIIIIHPRTGTGLNIYKAIYEPFKAAILQSLKDVKGKIFSDLTKDVSTIIRKKYQLLKICRMVNHFHTS